MLIPSAISYHLGYRQAAGHQEILDEIRSLDRYKETSRERKAAIER